jgi:hypothetical protein
VFDAAEIDAAALEDLSQVVDVLSRNRFQRIPIKGLNIRVTIEAKRNTAAIERIFVRQEKFEPGETVDVGVVLHPYRGEAFTTKAKIKVPEYAANGHAVLMVSGGPARFSSPGLVVMGGGAPSAGPAIGGTPNATSVAQLLQQYLEKEKNNQLVTRIVFAGPAVNVAGTTLSQLPSSLADVMRSTKSSALRTDRDEVKSIQDLDWLVSGAQSLPITIERKDQSEKRSIESGTAKSAAPAATAEAPMPFSPVAAAVSADEDMNEATTGSANTQPVSPSPLSATTPGAGRMPNKASDSKHHAKGQGHPVPPPPADATPDAAGGAVKTDDAAPSTKLVGRAAVRAWHHERGWGFLCR